MTLRSALVWVALAFAIAVPMIAAAQSPLLQWREPIYIIAGFSGIVALALLLVQPLLISGALQGVPARRIHVWTGAGLVLAVVVHVVGLVKLRRSTSRGGEGPERDVNNQANGTFLSDAAPYPRSASPTLRLIGNDLVAPSFGQRLDL